MNLYIKATLLISESRVSNIQNFNYRIRNLLKKGDELLHEEVTFEDETNPALILIKMAKESAKYKTRMEEINGFNEVSARSFLKHYFRF